MSLTAAECEGEVEPVEEVEAAEAPAEVRLIFCARARRVCGRVGLCTCRIADTLCCAAVRSGRRCGGGGGGRRGGGDRSEGEFAATVRDPTR